MTCKFVGIDRRNSLIPRHHTGALQHYPLPPHSTRPLADASSGPGSTMCQWEEIIYACDSSQHYGRKVQKMAYSCDIYRRHVYGPCRYDKRYDRPMTLVYSDEYCDECQRMFEYINYH
ncbi:uncharacterized protein P884DRAFT_188918 [Thermothelomyces heterothallicus CBS 202.75]|uniref:uncharacterized protein n=1 Tax=Thermothelomyces heterothallicus CBS 202.75 TaxID=1149848 RepID=UPI003743056B